MNKKILEIKKEKTNHTWGSPHLISKIWRTVFAKASTRYLSLPYLTGNGFASSDGACSVKFIGCGSLASSSSFSDKLNSLGGLSVKLSRGTKSQ